MFPPPTTNEVRWFKSSRSAGEGACVEVADADSHVLVRDSKDPSGPILAIKPAAWRLFITTVARGGFERVRD